MIKVVVFHSGALVHACRKSGRYLVGYEENDIIFNKGLQPLREPREGTRENLLNHVRKNVGYF